MTAEKKVLTVEEVADALRVDQETVRRLARTGDLRGFKVGSHWRFRQADVQMYASQQEWSREES